MIRSYRAASLAVVAVSAFIGLTVLTKALQEGVPRISRLDRLRRPAPRAVPGVRNGERRRDSRRFLNDRNSTNLSEWSYGKPKLHQTWPNDMGNHVGCAIADAYVRSHHDRKAAIRALIAAADPEAILIRIRCVRASNLTRPKQLTAASRTCKHSASRFCVAPRGLVVSMRSNLANWSQPWGRLTGVVYLLYFLTAIFGSVLSGPRFAVAGDIVNIVSLVCYIAVTFLLYNLFRPVSASMSLVAAVLSLAGCGTTALQLFGQPNAVNPLLFFGPFCILIGYLIIRSNFLPWALGALMVAAGIGWITFLSSFGTELSTAIKIVGILAEASLMLWLVAFDVNVRRWNEQAGIDTSGSSATVS